MGTALELARVLIASPAINLTSPVLFLFNGGEETVLTAAHGFMAASKWAPGVGAFINIESTGPAGPDVLFQHTGAHACPFHSMTVLSPSPAQCRM